MTRRTSLEQTSAPRLQPLSFRERVRLVDRFFEGRDEVHKTLRRLTKRLEKAGIAYAIMGGMAVNAQGHRRTTNDVDVLFTPEGFAEFRKRFVPKNYTPQEKRPRRLTDRINQITIDVLLTGLYPGRGLPGPIAFPDPSAVGERKGDVSVVNLVTLIQLKLAAQRYQDFADVVKLIDTHNLDESYLDRLHPSVRQDFIECLEEKRRDDEYNARNG
jgi:hypothetical protein